MPLSSAVNSLGRSSTVQKYFWKGDVAELNAATFLVLKMHEPEISLNEYAAENIGDGNSENNGVPGHRYFPKFALLTKPTTADPKLKLSPLLTPLFSVRLG